jgi:hypothetical protein
MNEPDIPFLTELRHEFRSAAILHSKTVENRSTRQTRRPSLLMGGGVTAIAAIAAALVLILTATSATPPAYAVTANPDGTVTVTIRQVSDPAAVNARLAQVGVRARLVPLQNDCSARLNASWRDEQPNTQPWSIAPEANKQTGPVPNWTVGIIPNRIPVGHTLVFALQEWHHRGWMMAYEEFKGSGPNCAAIYGSGETILHR